MQRAAMTSTAASSVALPGWRDAYLWGRANLERLATIAALGLIVWQREAITGNFASNAWSLPNFYAAAFNWSAIQVGFLFGAYAFFLSRSEPFIQAVAGSEPFMQLRHYVKRTLYLTFLIAAASVPLLVSPPAMKAGAYGLAFAIFTLFSCALVYSVFCMLKVIRVFGKLERPR